MFVLMIAYFYSDFLYIYYYERILGLRYSRKITFITTFCMWLFDCSFKLFPQYLWGLDQTGFVNLIMVLTLFLYALLLYNGSIMKRCLATVVYMVVQVTMDLLGMQIASLIVESQELFETTYVIASACCSAITITLGTVLTVWIWRKMNERKWKIDRYQWITLFLPASQYVILQRIGVYSAKEIGISSTIFVVGIVLGLIGDIYMFWLFERSNTKKKAEEELKQLQHQYELEKIRYTSLLKKQDEISKLRHDFQNYILIMKSGEQV